MKRRRKTYFKMLLRGVSKTRARFLSILAITGLGVGFLAGLLATTPDMQLTADTYYDDCHLFDVCIQGTLGLTEDDAAALAGLDCVENAMPCCSGDIVLDTADGSWTTRVYGVDFSARGTDSFLNDFILLEGRMPENDGECLIASPNGFTASHTLGETYTVSRDNRDYDSLSDTYAFSSLTAVGIVRTPYYMSIESEPSTAGSGTVQLLIFTSRENFSLDVYTNIYLTLRGAAGMDSFSDEYLALVDDASDSIESMGVDRSSIRTLQVKGDAESALADAQAEFDDASAEADAKLADAKTQLDEAQVKLDDGKAQLAEAAQKLADARAEIADGRAELDTTITTKKAELETAISDQRAELTEQLDTQLVDAEVKARAEIADGRAQLAAAREEADATDAELTAAEATLAEQRAQLEEQRPALEAAEAAIAQADAYGVPVPDAQRQAAQAARTQFDQALAQLNAADAQAAQGRAQLAQGLIKLEAQELALDSAEDDLPGQLSDQRLAALTRIDSELEAAKADGLTQIETARAEAAAKLDSAKSELAEGQAEYDENAASLATAEQELRDAKAEYESQKAEAMEKLGDAQTKLDDAADEIADIDSAEWYVTDRRDTISYTSFKSNSEKVAAIAKVFPVFFFLVAALVSLTTMTRMVDEERTQTGTLKALGYSDGAILGYYISYAVLASLIGSIIGILSGYLVLPLVIANAYTMMYSTPRTVTKFYWSYTLFIIPVATACNTVATLGAVLGQLREKPASLMQVRAPKAGRRVFLERVSFIWKRLSFTHKVTVRNILRYKKRFYMTVFGIAGCTALLVTGFGLRDSIHEIVDKQFGEIYKYNTSIYLNEADAAREDTELADFLASDGITLWGELHSESGRALAGDGDSGSVTIYVPRETESLKQLFNLRQRKSGADIPFTEDSLVLTEKLCEQLGLKVGDSVTLRNADGRSGDFTVTGITENYIQAFAFLSASAYESAFGEAPEYSLVLADIADDTPEARSSATDTLLNIDSVRLVSFSQSIRESFENTIKKLDYIIVVLIVCAGLLAVVVLYNLTNINICERKKELATIKVLGFHDGEIASYIYRETNILCVVGALVGLLLGTALHLYVVRTAEVDAVMFGRSVSILSYLLALAMTFVFTAIVDLIMLPKLRKIDMVESMKAGE